MFCSDVVENVIANVDYRGDESSAKLGAQNYLLTTDSKKGAHLPTLAH